MTVIAEPENLDVVADGIRAFVKELLRITADVHLPWELIEDTRRVDFMPAGAPGHQGRISCARQDSGATTIFSRVPGLSVSLLAKKHGEG